MAGDLFEVEGSADVVFLNAETLRYLRKLFGGWFKERNPATGLFFVQFNERASLLVGAEVFDYVRSSRAGVSRYCTIIGEATSRGC